MPRKTLPERADDSVRWTGIPTLVEVLARDDDRRRRHLRWSPLAVLLAGVVGSGLWLTGPRPQFAGPLLFLAALVSSTMFPLFGPVRPWGSLTLDEYDRELRHHAFHFAYAVSTVFALLAFVLINLWLMKGGTPRQIGYALSLSGGWLLILQGTLPTLWASWRTAPPPAD